ncbi:hypothetical protein GCM10018779_59240 [Streptomyces griseocarneus]|nr:hypothetical protein GCM10018779_59240 [Streptomyces griseocarneus]
MMHDFHLTRSHVVFMDLPVVFDPDRARQPGGGMPYAWDPRYGARLGVLHRDDPYGEVRWFAIDPCYVFHSLNAHDEQHPGGERIVLFVARYPHYGSEGGRSRAHATLWRWTRDLAAGTVTEEQLDDQPSPASYPGRTIGSPGSRPGTGTSPPPRFPVRPSTVAPCSATT